MCLGLPQVLPDTCHNRVSENPPHFSSTENCTSLPNMIAEIYHTWEIASLQQLTDKTLY